jgi:hypothetical protein
VACRPIRCKSRSVSRWWGDVMRTSLASAALRTQPKTLRTSLDDVTGKDARLRMSSEQVRISPNVAGKASFLALVDEARIKCDMTWKEFALNAEILDSVLSEARSGTRGHFAGYWVFSQPDRYVAVFVDLLLLKRGITKANRAQIRARQIGDLVTLLVESTAVSE